MAKSSGGGKSSGGSSSSGSKSSGGSSSSGSKSSGGSSSSSKSSSGSSSSGSKSSGSSKPAATPAAKSFAAQAVNQVATKQAAAKSNGQNKPGVALPTALGKPSNQAAPNKNKSGSSSSNGIGWVGGASSSKPSGSSNKSSNSKSSGNSKQQKPGSIQQVFGGGNLTAKEFQTAKKRYGADAVKAYIRDNTQASQLGGKLAGQLKNVGSMAGYFGKTASPTSPAAPPPPPAPGETPPTQQAWDSEAFNTALESQLGPLREQLAALQKNTTPQTATTGGGITTGGSGLSKSSYEYKPSDSSSTASAPSSSSSSSSAAGGGTQAPASGNQNLMPSLYNVWQSSQGSFNPASSAYMTSPGGTRRQDEAAERSGSAQPAGGPPSNDWKNFWNKRDGEEIQQAWASPSADNSAPNDNSTGDTTPQGVRRRPGRYSDSGQRMAGSVWEGSSTTQNY